MIILEAPQGIAGVWRVTNSTSLGLSSKIRGRVIVWLSEIFIQWNQGLCILVVSASELPVRNHNSFFVSAINYLGVLQAVGRVRSHQPCSSEGEGDRSASLKTSLQWA